MPNDVPQATRLGTSARRRLQALANGETDPAALAALAGQRLRATPDQTLCGAGGIRVVMAENLLLKQQLIVLHRTRTRAPNLTSSTETVRESQFEAPNDLRHEIIWELTRVHSVQAHAARRNGRQGRNIRPRPHQRQGPERQGASRQHDAARVEAVDTNYPSRSGLHDRLTAEGFELHWVREEMVGRRRGEGWEVVAVEDDGRRVAFQVPLGMPSVDPSALILMKRRVT